ncbi:MAG: hypothetical protein MUP09_09145 [Thiovulaceae bacterium]|nr:hypothetical protein [Sulfurimonadaceae bacterium]
MCDFNNLDDAAKAAYHNQLSDCAAAFGGMNFFLQLLEAIRKINPHPLMARNSEFRFSRGSIKWNKVIFKDKLSLLMKVRVNEEKNGNLLPKKDDKEYKNVLNLVRTLNPIEFEVQPKNLKDGDGFKVHAFDIIDDNITRLNPVFDALFFCSVDTIKKVLAYEPKAS